MNGDRKYDTITIFQGSAGLTPIAVQAHLWKNKQNAFKQCSHVATTLIPSAGLLHYAGGSFITLFLRVWHWLYTGHNNIKFPNTGISSVLLEHEDGRRKFFSRGEQ